MCPDAGLLSAYLDGEVPSPWKERIEEHLASCPSCAARLADYKRLARILGESASLSESDEAAAVARVRDRLGPLLDSPIVSSGPSPKGEKSLKNYASASAFWRRSVSLPLPAAAAAAIVVVFLAGIAASSLFRPAAPSIQTLAAAEIKPTKTQPENMEALISYLQSQDAQVSLTIRLPSGSTFDSGGKPLIVKAEPSDLIPLAGSNETTQGLVETQSVVSPQGLVSPQGGEK